MMFAEPYFGQYADLIDIFGLYCSDVSDFDFVGLDITIKQMLSST